MKKSELTQLINKFNDDCEIAAAVKDSEMITYHYDISGVDMVVTRDGKKTIILKTENYG